MPMALEVIIIKPTEIINNDYKIEIYHICNYKIAVHYLPSGQQFVITPLTFQTYEVEIKYTNGHGYIVLPSVPIDVNDIEKIKKQINNALKVIKTIDAHINKRS